MSDEAKEGMDRAEDQRDDVEAHSIEGPIGSPVDSPHAGATEEPPDVEGHMHGARPVEGRPVD